MTTVDLSWKLRAQKAEAALEVAQKENEGLSRDYQYLMKERDDAKEELEHVLDDWNALVKASGSRTNGAAIGHVAQMRAELERLRSQGAGPWEAAPNEQDWWWHWDGESLSVPFIYSVMVSHSGSPDRYFITYPDSRWCDELGGWWLKVERPNVPSREFQRVAGLASPSARTEILLSAARVNCEFCRQGREVFRAGDNWEHPYGGSSTQCRSAEIRRLIGTPEGQP